ncbi:macrolide 2'-phosphotransferase [bacterium]|nr:MAG: macrolide 2'-phosphotransferase [bacterium]
MSKDKIINLSFKNGLKIRPETIEINQSGLDFLVAYALDENNISWVLRVPRRDDVIETAAKENKILKTIRPFLSVSVPDWQIFNSEFIAYPKLIDEPIAIMDTQARAFVWRIDNTSLSDTFIDSMGKALASLHSIDHNVLKHQGFEIISTNDFREELSNNMNQAKTILDIPENLWSNWQNWLNTDGNWQHNMQFIHGDLHPGHILADNTEKVTGLLDWTEAKISDPAIDFTVFYAVFGEQVLDRLLAAYKNSGGNVWPDIKNHINSTLLSYPVGFATYAIKSGDNSYLDVAQAMINSSAESL